NINMGSDKLDYRMDLQKDNNIPTTPAAELATAAPTTTTRRNPSPYYYGDLFRDNEPEHADVPRKFPRQQPRFYRKSSSLDTPAGGDGNASVSSLILSEITPSSSCSGSSHNAASSAGSLLAACLLEWDALLMPPHRQLRGHQDLPSVCACAGGGQCLDEDDDEVDDVTDCDPRSHHLHHLHHQYHRHYRQPDNGSREILEEPAVDYDVPEEGEDEYGYDMSGRQRHLYETAFDCKVSRSDDDLDDVDRVTNHPVLQMFGNSKVSSSINAGSKIHATSSNDPNNSVGVFTPKERRKITLVRGKLVKDRPKAIPGRLLQTDTASSTTTLSQDLDGLELEDRGEEKPEPSPPLPLRGYSPSPPSTAPLPAKFHGNNKDILAMNSIRSAPNLPSTSPAHPRLKDVRLPVKSLRAREHPDSRKGSIMEFKGRPRSIGRPRGPISQESGPILEFKGRPTSANRRCGVRPKYSSTESMATSSSGGSLESIRSSTSEGNRSTTSSESHRSSSLSSHSSDSARSGSAGRFFTHQSNKLHILSPISDKSSQEPVSETSDNNRNNNSQKASPEDTDQITSPSSTTKTVTTDSQGWGEATGNKLKRRTPQNKNLINLTLQQQQSSSSGEAEIQGSDSGISIESRGGTKGNKTYNITAFSFGKQSNNTENSNNLCGGSIDNEIPATDFSDLPFDMPKLRRRRLLQQDTCTSGSATSVDLHDLPFDMPKLRRRLRAQPPQTSTESSGVSQASSSQSVRDADRSITNAATSRPSLTLNLEAMSSPKQRLGLSLNLGGSSFITSRGDSIDVQLPLERQGWYHGAITRVEAENVLRLLKEGSYLVRNSESTRQDYSLSLKSARGFMHMRIQQCPETGKFILGQFSKPFDNIPEMIHHYTVNRLPIRGAEHMCLLHPVIEQLL
ncbi:hypothetical protein L9F63_021345, partial [Diploptera punctata]